MMTDVERIYNLMYTRLYMHLVNQSPVLSGNMRHHIKGMGINGKTATIMISGPSYDVTRWRHTGSIVFTHKFNYAFWVNYLLSKKGRKKSSTGWVNRACVEVAEMIANEIGGIVINESHIPL